MGREDKGLSILSKGIVITGNIDNAEGNIQVDGTVQGDIVCLELSVSAMGKIIGSIKAEKILIAGHIEGVVSAECVNIEGTATIKGDVVYRQLRIDAGAVVSGQYSFQESEVKLSEKK